MRATRLWKHLIRFVGPVLIHVVGCSPGPVLDLGDDLGADRVGATPAAEIGRDASGPKHEATDAEVTPTGDPNGGRRLDAGVGDDALAPTGAARRDAGDRENCEDRACSPCDSDRGCGEEDGEPGLCGVAGMCVECLQDADCRGDEPYCDPAEGCVECRRDEDCTEGQACEDGECE